MSHRVSHDCQYLLSSRWRKTEPGIEDTRSTTLVKDRDDSYIKQNIVLIRKRNQLTGKLLKLITVCNYLDFLHMREIILRNMGLLGSCSVVKKQQKAHLSFCLSVYVLSHFPIEKTCLKADARRKAAQKRVFARVRERERGRRGWVIVFC